MKPTDEFSSWNSKGHVAGSIVSDVREKFQRGTVTGVFLKICRRDAGRMGPRGRVSIKSGAIVSLYSLS